MKKEIVVKLEKYHYTYRVTLEETGEFYIGVRSSKVEPELDTKYLGSMVSWKVNKKLLKKEIIDIYDSREEANEDEIQLIDIEKNQIKNKLCMNAHIPSKGFCMSGIKWTEKRKNNSYGDIVDILTGIGIIRFPTDCTDWTDIHDYDWSYLDNE